MMDSVGQSVQREMLAILICAFSLHLTLTLVTPAKSPQATLAAFVGYIIPLTAVWHILHRRVPHLSPADWVTMTRTVAIGLVANIVTMSVLGQCPPQSRAVVILSLGAIVLDGIDGAVARRTGTSSPEGARFDLEADAALVLILSVAVAMVLGWWALLIGAMRYGYLIAAHCWPALKAPLPHSRLRKWIGLAQGLALSIALWPDTPHTLSTPLVAVALMALIWSFGSDARQQLARQTNHAAR